MAVVYNYTRLQKRDKRLYAIFDTTLSSSGLAMDLVYTAAAMLAVFTIPGAIFCLITHTFWYNPIHILDGSSVGYFWMIFVFLPIVIAVMLQTIKIQNYKLITYLKMKLSPKKPLDQSGKKIKIKSIKYNTFIERS